MTFNPFVQTAHAASNATCVAQGFLDKINDAVFFPLIIFLIALAMMLFLWGGFKFILNANNPGKREEGRSHMIYGIIGLLVMTSAFTILSIAANSLDIGGIKKPGDNKDCWSNEIKSYCAAYPNDEKCKS